MHNAKLLQRWTGDWLDEDRNIFYLGPDNNKMCMFNMDHGCITDLKEHGFNVHFNCKTQLDNFLKFLIEQNSDKNKITYVIDFGFRLYPWYDIGCTELEEVIDSFSSVKGFNNLKWRFSNTYDLYSMEEENERAEWFKKSTRKLKQKNIIMDFVNFDIVDLYRKHLPNANINYRSVYFSRMVYSNLLVNEMFEPQEKRDKHVLCLNNIIKIHRDAMVDLCAEHEDKTVYSYVGRDKFLDCYPHELTTGPGNGTQDRPPHKIMNSAYTYISTETFFNDTETYNFENYDKEVILHKNVKYAYITEKTLKSAFYRLPMIICGLQGSLKTWKRLGFESFPEFFDESYDDIADGDVRLEKVKQEVEKILHTDIDEIHELYHSSEVQEKLEHNQQQFFKKYLQDFDYHTFKYKEGIHPLMDKIMGVNVGN